MIARSADYQAEMDYLVRLEARNKFIRNLALSLNGNTLLLFQYVEKHGKELYTQLKSQAGDSRNVYYVSGEIDGEEREEIRKIVETEQNAIIVASYGTFSTGVNIRNLHNVIFSSPSKSKIRNLQSIGRGLRKSDSKDSATLYDIADDMSWKSKKNFTLLHFMERIKIYNEEKFPYKIYNVNLNIS
jgi:superfamily II DNA or RNA helicase